METPSSLSDKEGTLNTNSEFPTSSLPWTVRLRSRFTSDIDTAWADTILLGCFFVAGIVDSVAFNTYSCFVSMQTGESLSYPEVLVVGTVTNAEVCLQETPSSQV